MAKDLVMKLCEKDQHKRITAAEALQHEWFKTDQSDTESAIKIDDFQTKATTGANPLASATPIMAGRMLADKPPETPFMTSN